LSCLKTKADKYNETKYNQRSITIFFFQHSILLHRFFLIAKKRKCVNGKKAPELFHGSQKY